MWGTPGGVDGFGGLRLRPRARQRVVPQRYDGTSWSGWQSLGGVLTEDPAAVPTAPRSTSSSAAATTPCTGGGLAPAGPTGRRRRRSLAPPRGRPAAAASTSSPRASTAAAWQRVTAGPAAAGPTSASAPARPAAARPTLGVVGVHPRPRLLALPAAPQRGHLARLAEPRRRPPLTPAVVGSPPPSTSSPEDSTAAPTNSRPPATPSAPGHPSGDGSAPLSAATDTSGITLFARGGATLYVKTYTTTWTDWTPSTASPSPTDPPPSPPPRSHRAARPPRRPRLRCVRSSVDGGDGRLAAFSPFTSAGVYIGGVNRAVPERRARFPRVGADGGDPGVATDPDLCRVAGAVHQLRLRADQPRPVHRARARLDVRRRRRESCAERRPRTGCADLLRHGGLQQCRLRVRRSRCVDSSPDGSTNCAPVASGAAMYSSQCSGIRDLAALYNDPNYPRLDAIWIAAWNGQPNLFGFGPPCAVSDTVWPFHQRIHQYQGGHNESYGGVTINVDRNAVDGPLPPDYGSLRRIGDTPIRFLRSDYGSLRRMGIPDSLSSLLIVANRIRSSFVLEDPAMFDELVDRRFHCRSDPVARLPACCVEARSVEVDERVVADPTMVAARVVDLGLDAQSLADPAGRSVTCSTRRRRD